MSYRQKKEDLNFEGQLHRQYQNQATCLQHIEAQIVLKGQVGVFSTLELYQSVSSR